LRRSRAIFQLATLGAVATGISSGYAALEGHLPLVTILGLSTIAIAFSAVLLRVFSLSKLVKQIQDAELARDSAERAHGEWFQRVSRARSRAEKLGVEPKAGSLRTVADQLDRAHAHAQELALWQRTQIALRKTLEAAKTTLSGAVTNRGLDVRGSLEEGVATYVLACQQRSVLAMQSSRRGDLQNQLSMRQAAEAAVKSAQNESIKAAGRLRAVADYCQIGESGDETAIVGRLHAWLHSRSEAAAAYQTACREWAELQELIGGGTLGELQSEALRRRQFANERRAGLDPHDLAALRIESDQVRQLERLRKELRQARSDADRLQGQRVVRASQLIAVSDAEEELEAATRELAAVRRLEHTLNATRDFLLRAQEQVHRTIAPLLAATVKMWLPTVTAARYVDVAVDPEDLSVRVKDVTGEWRNAALLSRGTSEQIFLLLRMAMATRLTRPGEVCPLLLDDVAVQFDNVRTDALLGVLHAISKERQIILFTQEDYVLAWARKNLRASIDCLRTLDMSIPDGTAPAVDAEIAHD
jgi:hypothetical protein